MKIKLNIELKIELSKSAMLRLTMKELVTFHILLWANKGNKVNYGNVNEYCYH